jgi:hypothetical protein
VCEAVDVSWTEYKASAELKGIEAEFVLVVPGGASAFAAFEIIAAKQVEDIGAVQVGGGIRLASLVNQEREVDAGFFAENARVVTVSKADGGERSTLRREFLLVLAQLRDMLAAEDSSIVTKKHDDGGVALPQRAEADVLAVCVGENDISEAFAESFLHVD